MVSSVGSRTERDVSYYADRLHVSPKYLSATTKRVTGRSVTGTIPERIPRQSAAEIVDKRMIDEFKGFN